MNPVAAIIRDASLGQLLSAASGRHENLDTAVSCPRCQIATEWPRWSRETHLAVERRAPRAAFLVGDHLRCRRCDRSSTRAFVERLVAEDPDALRRLEDLLPQGVTSAG